MRTCLIAAVSENGFIGVNGDLPWRIRSDMIRFRDLTVGDGGETNAV
ncbi:MAG: dihydrofolate reductase, partial [Candidatus Thermoplasmatota archaeon]|nr:dihydrofolate reductase [Candidatus Thermoplasmatota archaeon]